MIPGLQQLSTTTRDLRKFGLVVGGVFLLLGGWFLFRHKAVGPYFLIPGVVLVLFGFVAPRALEVVYIVWMSPAVTGSACLHGGPHALLLQSSHWTQGNRSLSLGFMSAVMFWRFLRVGKNSGSYKSYFCCFC